MAKRENSSANFVIEDENDKEINLTPPLGAYSEQFNVMHDDIINSDKPLSPILSNSKISRKLMYGRRHSKRKSKVKLTNRFASDSVSSHSTTKHDDTALKSSASSHLDMKGKLLIAKSIKQQHKLVDNYDKTNIINQNISKHHSCAAKTSAANDFEFKVPISPISSAKKIKTFSTVTKVGDYKAETNQKTSNKYQCTKTDPTAKGLKNFCEGTNFPSSTNFSGFKTATGKTISVSDTAINTQKKLFMDIMENDGNYFEARKEVASQEPWRSNKFTILRRDSVKNSPPRIVNIKFQKAPGRDCFENTEDCAEQNSVVQQCNTFNDLCLLDENVATASMMECFNEDWEEPMNITELGKKDKEPSASQLARDSDGYNLSINYINQNYDANFEINPMEAENSDAHTSVEYEMIELEKVLSKNVPVLDCNSLSANFKPRGLGANQAVKFDVEGSNTDINPISNNNAMGPQVNSFAKVGAFSETNFCSTSTAANSSIGISNNDLNSYSNSVPLSSFKSSKTLTTDLEGFKGFSPLDRMVSENNIKMFRKTINKENNKLRHIISAGCYGDLNGFTKSDYVLARQLSNSYTGIINRLENAIRNCGLENTSPRKTLMPKKEDDEFSGTTSENSDVGAAFKFEPSSPPLKRSKQFDYNSRLNEPRTFYPTKSHSPILNLNSFPQKVVRKISRISDSTLDDNSEDFEPEAKTLKTECGFHPPCDDYQENKVAININRQINMEIKSQNNFEIDINYRDMDTGGFNIVSEKDMKMSDEEIARAEIIYDKIKHIEKLIEQSKDIEGDSNNKISNKQDSSTAMSSNINVSVYKQVPGQEIITMGFSTAGGKGIKISDAALKKTEHIFENIDEQDLKSKNKQENTSNIKAMGFSTAGGKGIKISDNALKNAENIFENIDEQLFDVPKSRKKQENVSNIKAMSFSTAGGKGIKISDATLKKVENIFENIDEHELFVGPKSKNMQENISNIKTKGFSTAGGKGIKISDTALKKAENIFENIDEQLFDVPKSMNQQENISYTKATSFSKNQPHHKNTYSHKDINPESGSFSSAAGQAIKVSHDAVQTSRKLFKKEMDLDNPSSSKTDYTEPVYNIKNSPALHKRSIAQSISKNLNYAKKRLGVSICKQINVSNEQLDKAKTIFDDLEYLSSFNSSRDGEDVATPIKSGPVRVYNSTPCRNINESTQEKLCSSKPCLVMENSLINTNLTPVKSFIKNSSSLMKQCDNSLIILCEPKDSDLKTRQKDIEKECEYVKRKLEVLDNRQLALELQKRLIESGDADHRRQRLGVLSQKKNTSSRVSLRDFLQAKQPNRDNSIVLKNCIPQICPKTASFVHFNCPWQEGSRKKYPAVIETQDKAVVVPNCKNLVSILEIESAFLTMPGVEPKLLPKGWISNHFKWIVWKLASMECNYPVQFEDSFCLENVIQQLKYRYDREIDKAERPALRKIMEKDDVPQKRMVLCVSDIVKVTENKFELELTDGWYGIKTVVDQLLSKQIMRARIVVGTKLIIQCAELLNCDGCHPLDAPDSVRLSISYNCTRRALWDAKLGYQKFPKPFPIPLRSVSAEGGTVGCLKLYIARVYPVRYMERREASKPVWRNKKAEERRAQEWENEKMKKMEEIQHKVKLDLEKNAGEEKKLPFKYGYNDVSNIHCPKTLFEILHNSNDPDGMKEILSPSQLESVRDYQQNVIIRKQHEMSMRMTDEIKKLKYVKRDTASVLKVIVVDAYGSSGKLSTLSIWNPTEDHLSVIKEESMFLVYNITPKRNFDLASNSRTHFKQLSNISPQLNRFRRQLIPIALTLQSFNRPMLNEFDTIGTVVQTNVGLNSQDLWLTDSVGSLLLIKILEGPKSCCLFDGLNRGQVVAVTNLVLCEPQKEFGQALANQLTVISVYPQNKYLQDEMKIYKENMTKNVPSLLSNCDKLIEMWKTRAEMFTTGSRLQHSNLILNSSKVNVSELLDDSSEDNTSIPSRLTTTDVAMSLIDFEQFA